MTDIHAGALRSPAALPKPSYLEGLVIGFDDVCQTLHFARARKRLFSSRRDVMTNALFVGKILKTRSHHMLCECFTSKCCRKASQAETKTLIFTTLNSVVSATRNVATSQFWSTSARIDIRKKAASCKSNGCSFLQRKCQGHWAEALGCVAVQEDQARVPQAGISKCPTAQPSRQLLLGVLLQELLH